MIEGNVWFHGVILIELIMDENHSSSMAGYFSGKRLYYVPSRHAIKTSVVAGLV